jgi:hypothetical protein
MDSDGNINDLGRQYIGQQPPKLVGPGGNADGPKAPGGGQGAGSGAGSESNSGSGSNNNSAITSTIPTPFIIAILLIATFTTTL